MRCAGYLLCFSARHGPVGKLTLEQEIEIVADSKKWIEERAEGCKAYSDYLERWTDWHDPWEAEELVH